MEEMVPSYPVRPQATFALCLVSNNGWVDWEDCVTFWCQQWKSDIDVLYVIPTSYLSYQLSQDMKRDRAGLQGQVFSRACACEHFS